MVSTTITLNKSDVQPPVYVAGTFTEWSPIEMTQTSAETAGAIQNRFSHTTDLKPGQYQYKFRLGPGDWWVCDETTPRGMSDFLATLEAD
jgi:hypothetical protein